MFTAYSGIRAKNTLILQHDQSDCGLSCLASIINYHGGKPSLEKLRELSGTAGQETTILGLYQAAQQIGLVAEGMQAEGIKELREFNDPVILHVTIQDASHYFVMYGIDNESGNAVIGDPAQGLLYYTLDELDKLWQSKTLLKLTPDQNFVRSSADKERKRKWILELIKGEASFLWIAFSLGSIFTVLSASIAIFGEAFVDAILPAGNRQNFIGSVLLIAILLMVRSFIGYLKALFIMRQGKHFTNTIVEKLYNNLIYLPKAFFDLRKAGELTARMNDTNRIQSKMSVLFGNIIDDILQAIIFTIVVSFYSPIVAILVLFSIPFYAALVSLFNENIIRSQRKLIGSAVTLESLFIDTVESITTIKALNKESFFESLYNQVFGFFQNKILHVGKLNARFTLYAEIIKTLFIISAFALCSWKLQLSALQMGEIIAVLYMAIAILSSINRLAIANCQLQEVKIAFNRIHDFMIIKPENFSDPATLRSEEKFLFKDDFRLKIKNLSFRFPGKRQLLRNISLKVKVGEIIAIVGGSGSGKSTLTQILQKFYKPESGKIEINSIDLEKIPTKQWRQLVGIVPQEIKLFNNNLLYNLTLSEDPDKIDAIIEFCQYYGFDQYFESFPQSYLTPLGEDGVNISKAQQQLVALARALFNKPKLLLLDECFLSMDTRMERFVFNLLNKLKSTMAIVLVTHRLKPNQKADCIYILQNNELSASGSHDELMLTPNFYSDSMRESSSY